MARPDRSDERREELVPAVAATFAEYGYRRTTTAMLAERCAVQEAVLHRLWPDKRAMFVAAIEFGAGSQHCCSSRPPIRASSPARGVRSAAFGGWIRCSAR